MGWLAVASGRRRLALLYLLAHSQVSRIDRFLPPGPTVVLQKAGWISTALHDTGLVTGRAEASSPVS